MPCSCRYYIYCLFEILQSMSSLIETKLFVFWAQYFLVISILECAISLVGTLLMWHINMPDNLQVVTCGSIPLESSFQKVPRCIYVCTELEEYRGLTGKPANPKHCRFTWGCRHAEVCFLFVCYYCCHHCYTYMINQSIQSYHFMMLIILHVTLCNT